MDFDLPLSTRYSFTDDTDTSKSFFELSGGIGDFPATPELRLGYRVGVHSTFNTDYYYQLMFMCGLSETILLLTNSEIKQTADKSLDEYSTSLTVIKKTLQSSFCNHIALSFQHNFSRTNIYQEEVGVSAVLYPFLPLGYTDSLPESKQIHYYYDNSNSYPFNSVLLSEYWEKQPHLKLLSPHPEHLLNLTIRSAWQFFLPLKIKCDFLPALTGIFYTKKVEWFEPEESFDENAEFILENMQRKYAIIYNMADGKYYLNKERSDLHANSMIRLDHYLKWRFDCVISVSMQLERAMWKNGALYFSAGYLKGFSTIASGDPAATFNYGWNLQTGLKMNFLVRKR